MAYRKKTLRSMSPTTRKVARLIGEQESIAKRFKNLVPEIRRLELDSRALVNAKAAQEPRSICPDCWIDYTGSELDKCTECGRPLAFPTIKRYTPKRQVVDLWPDQDTHPYFG